jgi:hypothetical protein
MNYKQELESLIKMHNLLKKLDDAAYSRSMKDLVKTIKWKMRRSKDENNNR